MCVAVILQVYLNDYKRCVETLIKTVKVKGHVNSWVRVTHEINEDKSPTNNNDSTVYHDGGAVGPSVDPTSGTFGVRIPAT